MKKSNLILHQVQPHLLSVAHFSKVHKGNRGFQGLFPTYYLIMMNEYSGKWQLFRHLVSGKAFICNFTGNLWDSCSLWENEATLLFWLFQWKIKSMTSYQKIQARINNWIIINQLKLCVQTISVPVSWKNGTIFQNILTKIINDYLIFNTLLCFQHQPLCQQLKLVIDLYSTVHAKTSSNWNIFFYYCQTLIQEYYYGKMNKRQITWDTLNLAGVFSYSTEYQHYYWCFI